MNLAKKKEIIKEMEKRIEEEKAVCKNKMDALGNWAAHQKERERYWERYRDLDRELLMLKLLK